MNVRKEVTEAIITVAVFYAVEAVIGGVSAAARHVKTRRAAARAADDAKTA